jgi:[ribosomal protein S5]-alanine N-acetyltransferase
MQMPTITTARLQLRPLTSADTALVHAYTGDAQVMTYVPPHQMTWAQTQAFVAAQSGDDAQALAITLITGQLIGHIIFHAWVAPRTYELGWVIHPDYQRRGYASEAARAMMDYAFGVLDVHRIIATCQPENVASYRVMETLGMRREAHFRQCIHRGGDDWWDEYFYAILSSEWQKRL